MEPGKPLVPGVHLRKIPGHAGSESDHCLWPSMHDKGGKEGFQRLGAVPESIVMFCPAFLRADEEAPLRPRSRAKVPGNPWIGRNHRLLDRSMNQTAAGTVDLDQFFESLPVRAGLAFSPM